MCTVHYIVCRHSDNIDTTLLIWWDGWKTYSWCWYLPFAVVDCFPFCYWILCSCRCNCRCVCHSIICGFTRVIFLGGSLPDLERINPRIINGVDRFQLSVLYPMIRILILLLMMRVKEEEEEKKELCCGLSNIVVVDMGQWVGRKSTTATAVAVN